MSFSLSFFQTPEKKKSADKQNGSPDKKAEASGKPQNQVSSLKLFTLEKKKATLLHKCGWYDQNLQISDSLRHFISW